MIRAFHRLPGLLAMVLVLVLGLSGAALSVFPAIERLSAPQAQTALDVATLAARIEAAHPGIEQIRRSPSGRITAYWFDNDTPGAAVIDPASGQSVASADPNQYERWLTKLHRELFLGDGGRLAMAFGALSMLILCISGASLVARRMGGWRRWMAPLKGPLAGRIHVEIARVSVAGLMLCALTALYMSAASFDLIKSSTGMPAFPAEVSGETGFDLPRMDALAQMPVSSLRSLSFPYAGDAYDVFTLETDQGTGYIDQGTGAMLSFEANGTWQNFYETVYMLHSGQGAAVLGLMLGVMALGIPAMALSGALIWFSARRARPRIRGNASARKAQTIVLVGSEGGSTWGFAASLHKALRNQGRSVHVAPMSGFAPERYRQAEQIIVLAATYGDGAAPASAKDFLKRLNQAPRAPKAPLAILGFGDRSFAGFCAFAHDVNAAARAKGWSELLPLYEIDRQSEQDFSRWAASLGKAMGVDLNLTHQTKSPRTHELTLISRRDYGAEVQAPTSILRFALPRPTMWQRLTRTGFTRFQAGDLIGILPRGSDMPRLYSLASARRDGFVEIVVKRHPGGLCSNQLTRLSPGERIDGFLRPNPGFHARSKSAPLILIGAGTGIGPLAGIIRANRPNRPAHLFFGLRAPASDFLYGEEMSGWRQEGRLDALSLAISRGSVPNAPRHVQDALRCEAAQITRLIQSGARIMVCGGRDMAAGVREALTDILSKTGQSTANLQMEGRYVEDVY